jgi:para-aminobenzoate synthetase
MKILIIDNYDSFTFNLFQQIAVVNGKEPQVIENDKITIDQIRELKPDAIVLSPGPGNPERADDFGVCAQVIQELDIPTLGVCLGHQGIAHYSGGKVIHAPSPMHGRLSTVHHNGSALFNAIPPNFSVVRYHSLAVDTTIPDHLEPLAWTMDGVLMALRHRKRPLWGIQFHPESICTQHGEQLIRNFLDLAVGYHTVQGRDVSYEPGHVRKLCPEDSYQPRQMPENKNYKVCYRKVDAFIDPERAFMHFYADKDHAFWLGSDLVEKALSRFIFMGAADGPYSQVISYSVKDRSLVVRSGDKVTTTTESIFDYLNRELKEKGQSSEALPFDFNCGFAGYFGYELKADTGGRLVHESALPDAMFIFCDRLMVFDQIDETSYLVAFVPESETQAAERWFDSVISEFRHLPRPAAPGNIYDDNGKLTFRFTRPYETYIADIKQCLHEITEGESYEICLTNQLRTNPIKQPLNLYRILRRANPAPYASYLHFGDFSVLSSSPEQFLRVDRNGWVSTKPIKGTIARHPDKRIDEKARSMLGKNEKDSSENLIIVDLLRNDLGRVCTVGTIHVSKLIAVESYETVHQLVSTVRGLLKEDKTVVDCVRAAFPGGSMTGAPKTRTLEIIDRLESEARGVYSGSIGFIGLGGGADLNIVIRTAVCTPKTTSIGIGGAIVALSDPEEEFKEIVLKARALINAIVYTQFDEFGYSHFDITGVALKLLKSLPAIPAKVAQHTNYELDRIASSSRLQKFGRAISRECGKGSVLTASNGEDAAVGGRAGSPNYDQESDGRHGPIRYRIQ